MVEAEGRGLGGTVVGGSCSGAAENAAVLLGHPQPAPGVRRAQHDGLAVDGGEFRDEYVRCDGRGRSGGLFDDAGDGLRVLPGQ